ncbi:ATP-binding SpoIIE family protein phosphatase [Streptomyces sp. NBC_01408]|uniref:ATP-binding SpoIIE family protein phosphatase n=1 Tax=Streptomyces sp. NBC_01408 TaxID=2903855 RepID=UPI002251F870|nr:ATP-binding SpoIIE family protein phosphatase [Streptomyces sp. NBC_01408]MCX4691261.1 serine/threonine-protein phosphatase [Streptomyces sp. NBC_01408]
MTEYPTSQEGPQPAAATAAPVPGGSGLPFASGAAHRELGHAPAGAAAASAAGTDEPGHGKAPVPAVEATRPEIPAARTRGEDGGPLTPGPGPGPRDTAGTGAAGTPGTGAAHGEAGGDAAGQRDLEAARSASAADQAPQAPYPAEPARGAQDTGAGAGAARDAATGPGSVPYPAEPARSAQSREGDRLRFVGAATRRIARGIDLDEIVLGLCRATVPTFSDAILVYLRDPLPVGDERPVGPVVLRLRRTDRLRPIDDLTDIGSSSTIGAGMDLAGAAGATGELDFSQLPLVGPQGDLPAAELCEIRTGGALAEVLRGVRPVFGSSAAAKAALPELLGLDHPLPRGNRAVLAPLRGRRRVIGAAVFLRSPERPAFEQNDLLVAAQLATHTALGIDKAVLYGREAYIADELQRTMLPDSLPQPTGVRLASRYLPAAETARVGGDWYDAIPLPGSRVALVVGDVMGHSMTSAAIMGQLRTTAQTLAQLDLPPAEVLHHLDEQAQRLGSDRMATCLYAVYDPVSHRITIANAGHPPPVLLHLGGRAEVLRVPPGAPIGVGGVDFEAVELDAPAGATLLLYTDGLVESRLRDVWTGIEQLRERLATTAQLTGLDHPPPLEALCDDVLDMLGPGDRDDDIALLAARFDGIAPSDVAYWFLDPEETAPGRARRFARRALTRWGLEELQDSLELLVSEVVTNAVRYAERPVTLRLLRTDVLRCEVGDDSPQLPRQRRARDTDEGGRGLFLVNRMARRWGATRLSSGKVVWFELALPGAAHERR